MSDQTKASIAEQIETHKADIENLETHINLKDASCASEGEINGLQTEQQIHRDSIYNLKKANPPE